MNTTYNSPEGMNDPENIHVEGILVKCVTFASEEERKEALYKLCVETGALTESCVNHLIAMGFLTAPASTKYHGAYAGGLFDHSYNMATVLQTLTNKLNLYWDDPKSPVRVGILHDLCKIDQYFWDTNTSSYKYRDNILIPGHGIKSVVLSQQLPDVSLTWEETACIIYHMGAFTDKDEWKDYTNAVHRCPNVLWTHTADMYAAHVLEVI